MKEIMDSLPGPMKLNITILIIAALLLLLVVVLNKLIFKPVVAILDERRQKIEVGEKERKQSLKTVTDREAEYQDALFEARKKAQTQRLTLLKQAVAARDEQIAAARERASGTVHAAQTELKDRVEKARVSLEQETKVIAGSIVATILTRTSA